MRYNDNQSVVLTCFILNFTNAHAYLCWNLNPECSS